MEIQLTPTEARVLGCLIEKELSTPEYYPLTLNSLVAACNQKNNRDPVVEYDEKTVVRALEGLREKKLGLRIDMATSRVPKYKHCIKDRFPLNEQQVALLCTLLLRGPQTPGELRGRSERLYPFRDLEQVDEVLQSLISGLEEALVMALPRQPGRKEIRYAHLLSGEPEVSAEPAPTGQGPRLEAATLEVLAEKERFEALETKQTELLAEVEALKARIAEMETVVSELRKLL